MEGGVIMSNMICLCGLPGSGKTTWAKKFLKGHPSYRYFSPDEYHQRINGDECDRSNIFEVWMAMFREIHVAEKEGKDVLIDSDNLTFAQRTQWYEWFPTFDNRILYFFDIDLETCLDRMTNRKRTVPLETMIEKRDKMESPISNPKEKKYWNFIVEIGELE